MRGVIGRAAVAAAAVVALVGLPVGVASAGAGPAELAFQPAPYDYGRVEVGERLERSFTLANSGGRGSSALAVSVSGSAAFSIASDSCTGTSLGPGRTCTVSVRFAPVAVGTATAMLTAASKRQLVAATDALSGTGRRLGGTLERIYWTSSDGSITVGTLGGSPSPPLLTGQNEPYLLAVDSDSIYWGNFGDGTINKAPLGGGAVTVLSTGQTQPGGVAVDSNYVYWASSGNGTISRVPLAGGTPTTLYMNQSTPIGLAVDGNNVYWVNGGDSTIRKAPLTGGGVVTTLAQSNEAAGLAVDGTNAYWTTNQPGTGTIQTVPLTGGNPTTLVTGQNQALGIAVTSTKVYWASESGVMVAPLGGGSASQLFGFAFSVPFGVAIGP